MTRVLDSFKIHSGNKILDYRVGEELDLKEVELLFQGNYQVKKLWKGPRHVHGVLEKDKKYFLKLATSEGISVVTKNEFYWNDYFNKYSFSNRYLVPKNYDSGLFKSKYFYLITDFFTGQLLCETRSDYGKASRLTPYLPQIIELSEVIQQLPRVNFAASADEEDYIIRFLNKTRNWFKDVPINIAKKFEIKRLLEIVENGADRLSAKPRHGDFTPWHIIKLPDNRLVLIDGEHALSEGVESYDICYFIQRVFSVLKNPGIAGKIYLKLKEKGYQENNLKTVLAARAIGGFLDESLAEKSDYKYAESFKNWVEGLS
ncbi:hypothetical protein HYW43_03870 [Candidatus Daviesbacteria bacterium]|nr:hypothetical protein [Candidatus Daviesbacteria bacterium]